MITLLFRNDTYRQSCADIGPVAVTKIENKGKINRRIRIAFA